MASAIPREQFWPKECNYAIRKTKCRTIQFDRPIQQSSLKERSLFRHARFKALLQTLDSVYIGIKFIYQKKICLLMAKTLRQCKFLSRYSAFPDSVILYFSVPFCCNYGLKPGPHSEFDDVRTPQKQSFDFH